MKILTLKLTPKRIFGIILAVTGILVIAVTFAANHTDETQNVSAVIKASSDSERRAYLKELGWELDDECEEKELTIPRRWNGVYSDYNDIQKSQGFDLTDFKGKKVTLYTYNVTNYGGDAEYVVADMLVYNGELIAGDICSTSAENGFLVKLDGEA